MAFFFVTLALPGEPSSRDENSSPNSKSSSSPDLPPRALSCPSSSSDPCIFCDHQKIWGVDYYWIWGGGGGLTDWRHARHGTCNVKVTYLFWVRDWFSLRNLYLLTAIFNFCESWCVCVDERNGAKKKHNALWLDSCPWLLRKNEFAEHAVHLVQHTHTHMHRFPLGSWLKLGCNLHFAREKSSPTGELTRAACCE